MFFSTFQAFCHVGTGMKLGSEKGYLLQTSACGSSLNSYQSPPIGGAYWDIEHIAGSVQFYLGWLGS